MFVIYLGDSSEYFVNGIHVSQAKYMAELEQIGIVTKAQNCLVFQVRAVSKFSVISMTTLCTYIFCLGNSGKRHFQIVLLK